ncbi:major facilitator superfamily domain-containing protein [Aspergillus varians]
MELISPYEYYEDEVDVKVPPACRGKSVDSQCSDLPPTSHILDAAIPEPTNFLGRYPVLALEPEAQPTFKRSDSGFTFTAEDGLFAFPEHIPMLAVSKVYHGVNRKDFLLLMRRLEEHFVEWAAFYTADDNKIAEACRHLSEGISVKWALVRLTPEDTRTWPEFCVWLSSNIRNFVNPDVAERRYKAARQRKGQSVTAIQGLPTHRSRISAFHRGSLFHMPHDAWAGSSTCSLSSDGVSVNKEVRPGFHRSWHRCIEKDVDLDFHEKTPHVETVEVAGVTKIKAVEAVGGRTGLYFMGAGLVMVMVIYELDNSTVGAYRNFATSDFHHLGMLATLNTAASIITAIFKPPIAKLSDVLGRGEAYVITVFFYILSYILCASSNSFDTYAGGYVFYSIAQAGMAILNSTIVSDLSSMRWRGFAYNILYIPFLVTPWISAFIVDSVVNGIGWRWGVGMFAILMPFCASFIIITLLVFQWRARRAGLILNEHLTIYSFCSRIDLGGTLILSGGFALVLIPITLAATATDRWSTPWVDALIVLGVLVLVCLVPYEKYISRHPVVPVRYFRTLSVVIPFLLGCIDNIGYGATHTYLFVWSMVSHNFSPRDAQFLTYTNGVSQALMGMGAGLLMYRYRTYKWIGVAGAVIRMVGYGVMIRLRTNNSSTAELFVVQLVQGLGSGIIETIIIVAAQISVPHAELAQVTSLVMLGTFLGNGIGSAVAGAIYTGQLRKRLRLHLGPGVGEGELTTLYNSITETLPEWGTAERNAVNQAYSDVMGYITVAAIAFAVPIVILSLLLPNKKLGDGHNLVQVSPPDSPRSDSLDIQKHKQ